MAVQKFSIWRQANFQAAHSAVACYCMPPSIKVSEGPNSSAAISCAAEQFSNDLVSDERNVHLKFVLVSIVLHKEDAASLCFYVGIA